MSLRDPIEELLECLCSPEATTSILGNLRCCDAIDAIVALKARADKAEASRARLAALVRAMDLYDRESNGGLEWNAKNKARMGLIVARAAVDAAGDLKETT